MKDITKKTPIAINFMIQQRYTDLFQDVYLFFMVYVLLYYYEGWKGSRAKSAFDVPYGTIIASFPRTFVAWLSI